MALTEYRRKRRFAATPEPRGAVRGRGGPRRHLRFVVQKHRATRLHYDFRLEWRGVLLSWAVPKGPSLDPAAKRLAVPTEDHPLEYAAFEGVIPAGEYGAGTVMVWDRGTWAPEVSDVDAALTRGELKFALAGKKLRGSWVLVRIGGRAGARDPRAMWLLLKHRDALATSADPTQALPRSVVTGRLLAEIARDEGGDVGAAADGDPADEIRRLLGAPPSPRSRARSRRR